MTTTAIPKLLESHTTPGGSHVFDFEGFPVFRTTKTYRYLVLEEYKGRIVVVRGTDNLAVARNFAHPHSTSGGAGRFIIVPVLTGPAGRYEVLV